MISTCRNRATSSVKPSGRMTLSGTALAAAVVSRAARSRSRRRYSISARVTQSCGTCSTLGPGTVLSMHALHDCPRISDLHTMSATASAISVRATPAAGNMCSCGVSKACHRC
jgi:hypothetical protein